MDIFAKELPQLQELFVGAGLDRFRAKQVFHWLYNKKIFDFTQMHNLGKQIPLKLQEHFTVLMNELEVLDQLVSKDGSTEKVLLAFVDKNTCEAVLMKHDYGNSVCVSSQVGCAMGCKFCASGINGLVRNLTAPEMLAQIMYFAASLQKKEQRVSHIVIMGSGEPLMNMPAVLDFIRFAHDPETLNISYRNITISTSGIVPAIAELQKEEIPINLAISLHAPNDVKRSEIMPINKRYPLTELIPVTKRYAQATGRQVTYEYILIDNFNDGVEDAAELAKLLSGHNALVNLIPFNAVQEHQYKQTPMKKAMLFRDCLQKYNTTATIRKEMGADINAACGQLRNKYV